MSLTTSLRSQWNNVRNFRELFPLAMLARNAVTLPLDQMRGDGRAAPPMVVNLGATTKYWVRAEGHRIQVMRQHARFFLDEKPIRWRDDVWIWWSADDGFMLERFSKDDEELMTLPPDPVGQK